jgi:hypothetical protein
MPLAYIKFVDPRTGRPIDPGFGNDGSEYPDQGLPGAPGHPGNALPGAPGHPSQGLPWAPGRPDTGPIDPAKPWPPLPWPPRPWPPVNWPPDASDPDWGVDAGIAPSQPIYIPGGEIDNSLPPVHGHPSTGPVLPGTVWPPLPPTVPEGKAALLAWFYRLGWRYVVVDVKPPIVDNSPPSGKPPVAGTPLPPTPSPK